jgi:hypothetical protein
LLVDFLNPLFQLNLKLLATLTVDPSRRAPVHLSPSFLEKLRRQQMS